MKKLFPILLMVLGVAFVAAGGYAMYRGFDANDQVHDELVAQNITTPEDASIPNALVDDKDTAHHLASRRDDGDSVVQPGAQAHSRSLESRDDANGETASRHQRNGEREDPAIDTDCRGSWQIGGTERDDDVHGDVRQPDPDQTAHRRQKERLDEQLTYESHP